MKCSKCGAPIAKDENHHELVSGRFRCFGCFPYDEEWDALLRTVHPSSRMVDGRPVPGKSEKQHAATDSAQEDSRGERSPERPPVDESDEHISEDGGERAEEVPEDERTRRVRRVRRILDGPELAGDRMSLTDAEVIKVRRLLEHMEKATVDPRPTTRYANGRHTVPADVFYTGEKQGCCKETEDADDGKKSKDAPGSSSSPCSCSCGASPSASEQPRCSESPGRSSGSESGSVSSEQPRSRSKSRYQGFLERLSKEPLPWLLPAAEPVQPWAKEAESSDFWEEYEGATRGARRSNNAALEREDGECCENEQNPDYCATSAEQANNEHCPAHSERHSQETETIAQLRTELKRLRADLEKAHGVAQEQWAEKDKIRKRLEHYEQSCACGAACTAPKTEIADENSA